MPYADPTDPRKRENRRADYYRHREARLEYGRGYSKRPEVRDRVRAKNQRRRGEYRDRAQALKLASGCIDCGYADDATKLDLDHVRGEKVLCLSDMITKDWNWSQIAAEIAKCVVRCKDCHRARHRGAVVEW